ncbi:DnaJ-like protein 2 [Sarcoptes scabiei]|uniref:DnaJ-like protein 2 n=1 Tax=Sarcoptes scabiei TaxID=52283 RepID=A0A131ZW58_SARSC|nr:DnaJ-like protein 2 [Sarcoptes scabiei]
MSHDSSESSRSDPSNNDEYYAFLNVSKTATSEEIRSSFRSLSRHFHPDKHSDPALKQKAETMFNKLKKAYDVLSDPDKRAVYDALGASSLEPEGWALVERKFKSGKEIKEEYEKLVQEKEERLMQQRTNPKGNFTVLVDASNLFQYYYEDEDDEDNNEDEEEMSDARKITKYLVISPTSVEVRSMTLSQSIDTQLTASNQVTLNGIINVRNGVGSGNLSIGLRHIFNAKTWAQIDFGAGQGPMISVKGFRTITPNLHFNCSTSLHITSFGLQPDSAFVITRQFSKNLVGHLSYKTGLDSSMSTAIVFENEHCRVNGALQFGYRNSFISSSYTHKFQTNQTRVKLGLKFGLLGTILDYGCETKITQYSVLGAAMTVGSLAGINLRIKLIRNNQTYIMPIILSEELMPAPIFYGTILPMVAFYLVKNFLWSRYLKKLDQEEDEQKNQFHREETFEQKKQASDFIQLMKDFYDKICDREHKNNGLIIIHAFYGSKDSINRLQHQSEDFVDNQSLDDIFDFRIALQVLINEDSRLQLTSASKASLPGFFDPYPSGSKSLWIKYRFNSRNYSTLLEDNEGVTIPNESMFGI